jgi:hypothetical protein
MRRAESSRLALKRPSVSAQLRPREPGGYAAQDQLTLSEPEEDRLVPTKYARKAYARRRTQSVE